MRRLLIGLLSLVAFAACGESDNVNGSGPDVPTDKVVSQIGDREPFYQRNPMSVQPSFERASEKLRLQHTGWNFDNDPAFTVSFPSEYEAKRVILEYTMCAAGSEGPGEWDHTTMIFVRDKARDQWCEIARAFTPFGGDFDASWSKSFYIDVTDYQSLLKGDVEFRYYYGGHDATAERAHAFKLRFLVYEGDAERQLVAIHKLYDSNASDNCGNRAWVYGIADYDIEAAERLGERSVTIPEDVTSVELRLSITGHGHDRGTFPDRAGYETLNAAEFDENSYAIMVNGIEQESVGRIFYSNAQNYQQKGTYHYDRANWGPGNPANVHYWRVEAVGGNTLTLDVDLERFISEFNTPQDSEAVARYVVEADLLMYK